MAAINHGKPKPKKTFTELLPVIFPIASSAFLQLNDAVRLAKVSGIEVPIATNVIAAIINTQLKNIDKYYNDINEKHININVE